MPYTVSELAKLFQISRTTVYSKLKRKELKEFIHDTEHGKTFDNEGINTFKLLLSKRPEVHQVDTGSTSINNELVNSLREQIAILKDEIDFLRGQLTDAQEKLYPRQLLLTDRSWFSKMFKKK